MKNAAKRVEKIHLESFADMIWAVPLSKGASEAPGGHLLHRAEGLPSRGRRIILLRGIRDHRAPGVLMF